jgi:hypothetical protein
MLAVDELKSEIKKRAKLIEQGIEAGFYSEESAQHELIEYAERLAVEIYDKHAQLTSEQKDIRENAPEVIDHWSDAVRATPNAFLRTAIFAVTQEHQPFATGQIISANGHYNVHYVGIRSDISLLHSDLDIWLAALHLARRTRWNDTIEFSAWEILQVLGKDHGGKTMQYVASRLDVLSKCVLLIVTTQGKVLLNGPLLKSYKKNIQKKQHATYEVVMGDQLKELFAYGQYTRINWSIRYALIKKPIAKWLHGFYSTHTNPFPLTLQTISDYSGYKPKAENKLRQNIVKALQDIADEHVARELKFTFSIEDRYDVKDWKRGITKSKRRAVKDQKIVILEKTNSKSQDNHLFIKGMEHHKKNHAATESSAVDENIVPQGSVRSNTSHHYSYVNNADAHDYEMAYDEVLEDEYACDHED